MTVLLKKLKANGFKITPLRKEILNVFRREKSALTASFIFDRVRRKVPNAGLQSVYRNLSDFCKAGFIEEVFMKKRESVYVLCEAREHHHHGICRECGFVVSVDRCLIQNLSAAMKRLSKDLRVRAGFRVEHHALQFEGLCDACQKN